MAKKHKEYEEQSLDVENDEFQENSENDYEESEDTQVETEIQEDNEENEITEEQESVQEENEFAKEKKKVSFFTMNSSSYMSYERRIAVYLIIVLGCAILSTIFLTRSLSTGHQERISYQESSNLDYKVYLKKNDFYETKYLDKNMVYVASLIKRIDVDINYAFNIDRKSDIQFDYDIIGKLSITDNDGKNTFFEKEYTLLDNKTLNMTAAKKQNISEQISINYDYYNNLANKFRSDYGIETKSDLTVYFRVNQKSAENSGYKLNNNSNMTLTIPLSEKAINIKMDYKEINKNSQLFNDTSLVVSNYIFVGVSIILIIVIIIFIGPLIKLLLNMRTKKSTYDKYIDRILNEYDRLIVNTTTPPNMINNNIVKVNSFEELLDVRDNLGLPIKYYVINKHQKCNFYINHNDELYLLVLKAVDLEENNK